MKAVIDALNVTYNEKEKRGFIKLNLISLALTGGQSYRFLLPSDQSWCCLWSSPLLD
jgi:hypothetical protein